jgi:two-component SAPR family response regulator
MTPQGLNGIRVLVVEDEYLLADDLRCTLEEAGATVVGPAGTSWSAYKLIQNEHIHLALVDINLHGVRIFPIAHLLREKHIPFVFVTGYEHGAIPVELMDIEYLGKPVPAEKLLHTVARLCARQPDAFVCCK